MSSTEIKRHTGQKIALGFAVACLLAAMPTAAAFVWAVVTKELSDTWVPSLLATTAFFISCAAVCYVMSRPQPPLPISPETSASDTTPAGPASTPQGHA